MHDHLFYEPMKNLSNVLRASAIETERKLVEISLEVLFLNATLVGCAKPAFK